MAILFGQSYYTSKALYLYYCFCVAIFVFQFGAGRSQKELGKRDVMKSHNIRVACRRKKLEGAVAVGLESFVLSGKGE